MVTGRNETRDRILQAASELAWETGPGNLSLDAVAAKAGVSKGGLLYHFPSKSRLLEATVETFVQEYDQTLKAREADRPPESHAVAHAYLDLFVEQHVCKRPPSSGILAALAEDPSFLNPVRRYERELLDRIKADLGDPELAMILYCAISGLKSSDLLSLDVAKPDEIKSLIERLRALISQR
ncbi:TetR/AcrR family transcriptional regulator [Tianweitania sp.]|uniref:TetR/AcrR family transcriptional regulator n=1 Tax=Tianweitania sp. TaxID=2021634 RepID=UPI0028A0C834|nr:TetR/AcrR family transcriptional regulator [Tianweitania sp.]